MELKCGDVVQLKSGSPLMTVEEIGRYKYGEHIKNDWSNSTFYMNKPKRIND